jgi:mannose-6-phosphate isomerase-like protein (cupin superfamily)
MKIRRIVTGHDANGRAVVVSDGEVANVVRPANRPGVELHNIWQIDSTPAPVFGPSETTAGPIGLLPPKSGSVFRVVVFPPEQSWIDSVSRDEARQAFASMGAAEAADPSVAPAHPLMHRTETVDYALCLEGEIHMVLDDSETLIKPGDAVIQRGTNHAWSNRGERDCKMLFVLLDGTFGS